jgi:PIN domain nuclease of toxin-antitoxin system
LDTHVVFWWLVDKDRLSKSARVAIEATDAEVQVSIASAWEVAIKVGLGKWPEATFLVERFEQEMTSEEFRLLPVSLAHVRAAGLMTSLHRDPFDRLLAAQAAIEGLSLVTADPKIGGLGAPVLW